MELLEVVSVLMSLASLYPQDRWLVLLSLH